MTAAATDTRATQLAGIQRHLAMVERNLRIRAEWSDRTRARMETVRDQLRADLERLTKEESA